MALDTRQKRSSAIAARKLPWLRRFTLPLADGTIDQADRQQTAYVYAGILAGEPADIVSGPYRIAAADAFIPGGHAGDMFAPGGKQGSAHRPGAVAGEGY